MANQYQKRAKEILARRAGVKLPTPNYYPQNTSPVKQMESMADKILARRGEKLPKREADTVEANFDNVAPMDYERLTKKELKAELDELGIEYPSKATNQQLIKLLLEA